MTEDLIALTDKLNEVLAEENALLDALDLPAAVRLLPRKRDAVAALQGALAGGIDATALSVVDSETLRDSVQRLIELGDANRTAIERGLALQMQLIQTIAQAVPRGRALEAPNYQPDGSQVPARPADAYAFLSRM
ncbi:MAG: hypothetical protein P4L71_01375 [Acetobacteraceae bacterium]|nr:hypothetical protein [Acetobacteraceae bacterium]